MREARAPYAPAERMIAEALDGLAEVAGPGRHWVPVSAVARAARRSISATSVALRVAEDRGLAETRLRSLPGGSRWEYRPAPAPTER
jgi:hypothetical protein